MTPYSVTGIVPRILVFLISLTSPLVEAQTTWKDFEFFSSNPGRVQIQAGRLTAREGGKRLLLEEGVHLSGSNLDVRADWAEIWAEEERVVLAGSVRVIEGKSVLLCDRLELTRPASAALVHNAVILVKEQVSSESLTGCRTASQLFQSGFNTITLQGESLKKEKDHYDIDGARFTACDCKDEAPSWEIRSSSADVLPGERAWLYWPVLYLKGIPVFALPAAYLPLSERRTGLLFPQINYSGRDGFVLSESFFLTLGDSADTTFSLDWFEERGFRERFEFRVRPSVSSHLDARFSYMRDEKKDYTKKGQETWDEDLKNRFSVELDANADGPGGTSLRSFIRLYSDSDINRHFLSDMYGRAVVDAPSVIVMERRGEDVLWTLDLVYRQDLRFGAVDLLGSEAHDTIHRLGALTMQLAPVRPFDWPLEASLTIEVANLSSLANAWRDWGIDGTPNLRERSYEGSDRFDRNADNFPAGGEEDLRLGDGELRRAFRLMLEPELHLPLQLGPYLLVEPYLSHRQLAYLPHGPEAPGDSTRGMTFGGLILGSQLSRAFGTGEDRIGHAIAPSIRMAGAWRGLASDGPRHYLDFRDRPFEDAFQLLVGLDNALYSFQSGWHRFLGLGLSQGIDLRNNRLSQGSAVLDFSMRPLLARVLACFDWDKEVLAELDASATLRDRRGDSLQLTYLYLAQHRDHAGRPLPLSERTQREDGLLFGLMPSHYRGLGETIHVLNGQARLYIAWGLSLNAGASLNLRTKELSWYGGGINYDSDCRCWGFSLMVRMLQTQDFPDILFMLDLAYLGATGVGTNTMF